MPIDWNNIESLERLLAAVYAASPQNPNYRLIATYYGEGATYDSIEGRFRRIRPLADTMKREVDNGERPPAPPRGGGSVHSTPRKKRSARNGQGVSNAKITKSKTSPSKRAGRKPKQERVSSEDSFRNESNGDHFIEYDDDDEV